MKFCPVVPEICHGQVHGARKERRIRIIIRNRAKTISLGDLIKGCVILSFVSCRIIRVFLYVEKNMKIYLFCERKHKNYQFKSVPNLNPKTTNGSSKNKFPSQMS